MATPSLLPKDAPIDSESVRLGRLRFQIPRRQFDLVYETLLLDVYRPLKIQTGDVVLDVGANIGDFTIRAARKVGPEGRVIAIEPNPVWFHLLEQNVAGNGFSNVILLRCALAHDVGRTQIMQDKSLIAHDPGLSDSFTADCRTLDSIVDEFGSRSRLVGKMDIEGWEGQALSGQESLRRFSEWILEVHGPSQLGRVTELLTAHHFRISRVRLRHLLVGLATNTVCALPWVIGLEVRSNFLGLRRAATFVLLRRPLVIDEEQGDRLEILHAQRGDGGPRNGR